MTTTLITGANKGLGRETARRLVQAGHDVYLGARDPERGAAAARELGCRFVVLVVLDDDSVTAAADTVEQQQGALDVLINNAGITGGAVPAEDTTAEDVQRVYATTVLGVGSGGRGAGRWSRPRRRPRGRPGGPAATPGPRRRARWGRAG